MSKNKVSFGTWIHRQIFKEAAKVHPECFNNEELIAAIRSDIVIFGIGGKPSISSLSAEGKAKLVNRYLEAQGARERIRVPAKYDKERRAASAAGNPASIPTPDQTAEIERLFNALGVPASGRPGLCERTCGRKVPSTRVHASKVIDGLRAMRDRGWRWAASADAS